MASAFARLCAAAIVLLASSPAMALTYDADLGPMPLDDTSKPSIQGRGNATASLDGNRLTISASFSGLASSATAAHLNSGIGIGVPGPKALDLTVTPSMNGSVTGSATLTARQAAAFRTGQLYLQIDSRGAPDGNLWGWFLPRHDKAGQDEPQQDHWFLPQLDTPSR